MIALVTDGKQSCAGTTETVHRPNRPDVRQRRADPLPPCDGAPRAEGPQRFCPQRVAVRRRPAREQAGAPRLLLVFEYRLVWSYSTTAVLVGLGDEFRAICECIACVFP